MARSELALRFSKTDKVEIISGCRHQAYTYSTDAFFRNRVFITSSILLLILTILPQQTRASSSVITNKRGNVLMRPPKTPLDQKDRTDEVTFIGGTQNENGGEPNEPVDVSTPIIPALRTVQIKQSGPRAREADSSGSVQTMTKLNNAWKTTKFKIKKTDDGDEKVYFNATNLTDAVEANNFEEVKRLIHQLRNHINSKGGDIRRLTDEINYWDSYALRHAAERGYTDIVDLLLYWKANPTAMDSEAVQLAAQNGHKEIVEMLVKRGSRYQNHQDYALRSAARLNHTDVVMYLLGIGGDPKAYDGFALLCTEDPYMNELLTFHAYKSFTEKDIEVWKDRVNFGKYGTTFCREIDENNLRTAGSGRAVWSIVAAVAIMIFV